MLCLFVTPGSNTARPRKLEPRLEEVPLVAPGVAPDRHGAVGLSARGLEEGDALRFHARAVPLEVIRVEDEAHAPPGLTAQRLLVRLARRHRQEEARSLKVAKGPPRTVKQNT